MLNKRDKLKYIKQYESKNKKLNDLRVIHNSEAFNYTIYSEPAGIQYKTDINTALVMMSKLNPKYVINLKIYLRTDFEFYSSDTHNRVIGMYKENTIYLSPVIYNTDNQTHYMLAQDIRHECVHHLVAHVDDFSYLTEDKEERLATDIAKWYGTLDVAERKMREQRIYSLFQGNQIKLFELLFDHKYNLTL